MTRCLLILTALFLGCHREPIPAEYRDFFELSMTEQMDSLKGYSLDDQVRIYMIGVTRFAPPKDHLANPLASNGVAILPTVLESLSRTKDPHEFYWLLAVLEQMGCFYYDLREKPEVIAALDTLADGLPSDYWTTKALASLRVIRRQDTCTLSESQMRQRLRELRERDSVPD